MEVQVVQIRIGSLIWDIGIPGGIPTYCAIVLVPVMLLTDNSVVVFFDVFRLVLLVGFLLVIHAVGNSRGVNKLSLEMGIYIASL